METATTAISEGRQLVSGIAEFSISLSILTALCLGMGAFVVFQYRRINNLTNRLISIESKHAENLQLVYNNSKRDMEELQKITVSKTVETVNTLIALSNRISTMMDMLLLTGSLNSHEKHEQPVPRATE
jgi:predicted PurR-regulated permease PerM